MWIRINDVICNANDFSKFYIEMYHGQYNIMGENSNHRSTVFTHYNTHSSAKAALDGLYTALERGDRTFTMPNRPY